MIEQLGQYLPDYYRISSVTVAPPYTDYACIVKDNRFPSGRSVFRTAVCVAVSNKKEWQEGWRHLLYERIEKFANASLKYTVCPSVTHVTDEVLVVITNKVDNSLTNVLKESTLTNEHKVDLFRQLALAVQELNDNELTHGRICAENVVVTKNAVSEQLECMLTNAHWGRNAYLSGETTTDNSTQSDLVALRALGLELFLGDESPESILTSEVPTEYKKRLKASTGSANLSNAILDLGSTGEVDVAKQALRTIACHSRGKSLLKTILSVAIPLAFVALLIWGISSRTANVDAEGGAAKLKIENTQLKKRIDDFETTIAKLSEQIGNQKATIEWHKEENEGLGNGGTSPPRPDTAKVYSTVEAIFDRVYLDPNTKVNTLFLNIRNEISKLRNETQNFKNACLIRLKEKQEEFKVANTIWRAIAIRNNEQAFDRPDAFYNFVKQTLSAKHAKLNERQRINVENTVFNWLGDYYNKYIASNKFTLRLGKATCNLPNEEVDYLDRLIEINKSYFEIGDEPEPDHKWKSIDSHDYKNAAKTMDYPDGDVQIELYADGNFWEPHLVNKSYSGPLKLWLLDRDGTDKNGVKGTGGTLEIRVDDMKTIGPKWNSEMDETVIQAFSPF